MNDKNAKFHDVERSMPRPRSLRCKEESCAKKSDQRHANGLEMKSDATYSRTWPAFLYIRPGSPNSMSLASPRWTGLFANLRRVCQRNVELKTSLVSSPAKVQAAQLLSYENLLAATGNPESRMVLMPVLKNPQTFC